MTFLLAAAAETHTLYALHPSLFGVVGSSVTLWQPSILLSLAALCPSFWQLAVLWPSMDQLLDIDTRCLVQLTTLWLSDTWAGIGELEAFLKAAVLLVTLLALDIRSLSPPPQCLHSHPGQLYALGRRGCSDRRCRSCEMGLAPVLLIC